MLPLPCSRRIRTLVEVGGEGLDASQASAGLEIGSEAYSEILFFGNKKAFEAFQAGEAKFAAGATAYAIKAGAAAIADYSNGVAVFVKGKGGLMADASIGGQLFSFVPTPSK